MHVGGLILAGGQGSRMGYLNKGLVQFKQQSLVDYLLNVLNYCTDYVAISANRDLADYRQRQVDVFCDQPRWQNCGPLAGVISSATQFPEYIQYIQVVPCDTPFLDSTVILHLSQVLQRHHSLNAVYARTPSQIHPVIMQFHRRVLPQLEQYLQQEGKHSIRKWLHSINAQAVDFEDEKKFINMNDLNSLKQFDAEV